MKKLLSYFTMLEILLWGISNAVVILAFVLSHSNEYVTLAASLIGASSLILNAKGNAIGQILIVVFSVLYGIVSFTNAYYGEMITYLGMTAPLAVASVISWIRNPAEKGKSTVKVNHLCKKEFLLLFLLSFAVTVIFYFILKYFNTALLPLSTLSIFTSFAASYLTIRRSEFYAIAYAANDIVLIIMWAIASIQDKACFSVAACFTVFLINDIYGFISWQKMRLSQEKHHLPKANGLVL